MSTQMNRETNATLASTATKGTIETNVGSVNTYHSASTGLTGRTSPSDRWMVQSREALLSREENQVKNPVQKVFSLVENAKRERRLKRKKKKKRYILGTVLLLGAVLVAVILTGTVSFENGLASDSNNDDDSDSAIDVSEEEPDTGSSNPTTNPDEITSSESPTVAEVPSTQAPSKTPTPSPTKIPSSSPTATPTTSPTFLSIEDIELVGRVCNDIPGRFTDGSSDGSFSICLSESHQLRCDVFNEDGDDSDEDTLRSVFINNNECESGEVCNCGVGQLVDTTNIGINGCELGECISFSAANLRIFKDLIDANTESNNDSNDGETDEISDS